VSTFVFLAWWSYRLLPPPGELETA
jgi:hypothetical protein